MTVEVFYPRIGSGAACGPGTREGVRPAPGNTNATYTLTGSFNSWSWQMGQRLISSGRWTLHTWISGGNNPIQHNINIQLNHYDHSCNLKTLILGHIVAAPNGIHDAIHSLIRPEIRIEARDFLVLSLAGAGGPPLFQYDGQEGTQFYSRILIPTAIRGRTFGG